jgi:hypothetical protein
MPLFSKLFPVTAVLAVIGCASLPNGPSVMVLPGSGLPFEQFRNDDMVCRQYAYFQVGGTTTNQAAVNSGVANAAIGTALGAAAGAAIGGGRGAAIGAGAGLLAGSMVGADTANSSMYGTQERYDMAYIQCMYAKGHQVPVSGQFVDETPLQTGSQNTNIPPPPEGFPPPPPFK